MKKNPIIVLGILLLCAGVSGRAATYYVSSISGNDSYTTAQAQNQATPWKSMAKVNSFWNSLNPGDTIKLQCGSIFTSALYVGKSGTAGKPIVLTTYGTGSAPLLTGFVSMGTWTSVGGNIWQQSCPSCGGVANMVEIGDSSQPMGRWPNSGSNTDAGYNQIQSANGTVSITDSRIGASGHNWTGSHIAIRKATWILENDSIISQSGNTITYQTGTTFPPGPRFGYFIQGHAGTLDQNGEWYYNAATKTVSVYATSNPSSLGMQVARVDTLLQFNGAQYVVVNGIIIEGSNKAGVSFFRSNYITLQNCSILYNGIDAIDCIQSNYLNINNVVMDYSNNNAVTMYGNSNYVQNCTIRRTAAFPGMMLPANSGIAVYLVGNNNYIQYNTIDTTGYSGISFQGSSNTISHNLINYFCFVKDDGGGIYTWDGNLDSTQLHTTGWITNNIVVNGVTAPAGTDTGSAPIAMGIYLDENTTECIVTGNTVAHTTAGIFFQDSRHCSIQGNTIFDNIGQLVMRHALATGTYSNNDVSGNYCITRIDTQYIVEVSSIGSVSKLNTYDYQHANHYAQLAPNSYFYLMAMTDYYGKGTFGAWQTTYGKDWLSNNLPLNFAPYTVNSYIGGNKYTKGNIITPFSGAAAGTRVITSAGVGAITQGAWYVLNYTMYSPDNLHVMLNFLEEGVVPYPKLSPVTSIATAAPSSNNQIVWQATGTYSSGLLVFQNNANVPSLWLGNISFYQANVTANNPAGNYIFQYNATKSAVSYPLSGTYQDAAGVSYTGSVSIPAYGSVLLIKKS